MSDTPSKPVGPFTEQQLMEQGFEWVLCGGLHVGNTVHPRVWRLRPVDEVKQEEQRTREFQQAANLARKVATLERELAEAKEEAAVVKAKFVEINDEQYVSEREIASLEKERDALCSENAKLKSQVASLQAHNDATVDDSQLIALAKERDSIRARLAALEKVAMNHSADIASAIQLLDSIGRNPCPSILTLRAVADCLRPVQSSFAKWKEGA